MVRDDQSWIWMKVLMMTMVGLFRTSSNVDNSLKESVNRLLPRRLLS